MDTEDLSIARYLALNPYEFSLVDRLEIRRLPRATEGGPGVSIEMELLCGDLDDLGTDIKLRLKFYHVTGLRLDVDGMLKVSQLEIHSIRDRGWEHLHYVVEDTESVSEFKFYCDWFEAELRRRTRPA